MATKGTLLDRVNQLMQKEGYMPPAGGAPPMDPAMMAGGGAPPMDPAMMMAGGGGAPPPPMDPAMMMGGGAPPMDPSMDPSMMGAPPMDPSAMPPMDPAAMGGMPPMDPSMMGGEAMPPIMVDINDLKAILQEAAAGGSGESKSGDKKASSTAALAERVDALNANVGLLLQHFSIPPVMTAPAEAGGPDAEAAAATGSLAESAPTTPAEIMAEGMEPKQAADEQALSNEQLWRQRQERENADDLSRLRAMNAR